jgi:predicted PurR-regulated permease PerM
VFFFVLSLVLSLVLAGTLLAVLLHSLQVNRERKNHRPISYLSPAFMTFVFITVVVFLAVPQLLDLVSMAEGAYVIQEMHVDQSDLGWNSLQDGQQRYVYNHWQFSLVAGRTYRITSTPHGHFIIDVTEIAETISASQRMHPVP